MLVKMLTHFQDISAFVLGIDFSTWTCEKRTMFIVVLVCVVFSVLLSLATVVIKIYLHRLQVRDITKKCVFITGCDTGFGNLLAKHLDSLGVKVIAGCLTERGGRELQEETSSRLKTVLIDITKTESVQNAFQFVQNNIDENGRVFQMLKVDMSVVVKALKSSFLLSLHHCDQKFKPV